MRRVVICSPCRGDTEKNQRYLAACLRDSFDRDEAPIASHAIGPLCLDEDRPGERAMGMRAGMAWIDAAEAVVIYVDEGWSEGMLAEEAVARGLGIPIEYRKLGGEWLGGNARVGVDLARPGSDDRSARATIRDGKVEVEIDPPDLTGEAPNPVHVTVHMGTGRLECARCGASARVALPAFASDFRAHLIGFCREHTECEKVEP